MDKNIEERIKKLEKKVGIKEELKPLCPELLEKNYTYDEIQQMKSDVACIFKRYNLSINEAKELLNMTLQIVDDISGKIRVWDQKN